jgi:nucleotide-binding universal stress UspA family protein
LARSAAVVRRVTCCVDGSPHALAALTATLRLPLFRGADVTLLAVDDGTTDTTAALAAAQELAGASGCRTRGVTTSGRAPQRVLTHVEDERPDLLVLGSRGWNAWERMGSVAARVVRHPSGTCLLATAVA